MKTEQLNQSLDQHRKYETSGRRAGNGNSIGQSPSFLEVLRNDDNTGRGGQSTADSGEYSKGEQQMVQTCGEKTQREPKGTEDPTNNYDDTRRETLTQSTRHRG